MHADLFDRYKSGNSLLHRLDPRVKVVATVLFVLSNVLLPDGAWLAFGLSWALVLLSSWLSELGAGYALRRSFIALPFALAGISAIFALPGETLAAFDLGPWHLVATDTGLLRFASVVVRSWLSVQGAILLVATTSFPDLMHAFRHLRVPSILVAIISFMYRYLFVLSDETMRLLRAREARSARLPGFKGGGTVTWQAQTAGNMAGQLFLRSYERSERVYNAMLARGYQGTLLTMNPHEMDRRDWQAGLVILLLLIALQWVGRL